MLGMNSIISATAIAVVSLGYAVIPVNAQNNFVTIPQPEGVADGLSPKTPVEYGCYSSPGDGMIDMGISQFQTSGFCQAVCIRIAKPYMALFSGRHCLCGDNAPSQSDKLDNDDTCNTPCPGFPQLNCGGSNAYYIYGDGYEEGDPTGSIKINVPTQTTAATTAGVTAKANTVESSIKIASTIVVYQSGTQRASIVLTTQTATPESSDSGPNKAIIAAGVVVGILVVAALVGAVFFVMRHKKNKALEEERQRHEAMTALATGEKPPSTYSLADSRLEPSVMFQRRQSDGSIMDNHDYSRRILKVTNPDDR